MKENEKAAIYCPMTAGKGTFPGICTKEQCRWFSAIYNECAVLVLAESTDRAADQLERME